MWISLKPPFKMKNGKTSKFLNIVLKQPPPCLAKNVKHQPVSGESHHVGVLDIFSKIVAAGFLRLEHLSLQDKTKTVDQNFWLFNASKMVIRSTMSIWNVYDVWLAGTLHKEPPLSLRGCFGWRIVGMHLMVEIDWRFDTFRRQDWTLWISETHSRCEFGEMLRPPFPSLAMPASSFFVRPNRLRYLVISLFCSLFKNCFSCRFSDFLQHVFV